MHVRGRWTAVAAAVLLASITMSPLRAESRAPSGVDDLGGDIDRILTDPRLAVSQAGVVVKSAQTGEVLYSRNGDNAMLPASNEKLLTSAAGLDTLGTGHTFRTTVALAAGAAQTVDGDLYLKGTGDPTMQAADYDDLAAKVAASGVKKVRGDLVGDDSWFDEQRLGPFWAWDDEPFCYSAQVSALTVTPDTDFNAGCANVEVRPGAAAGQPAQVSVVPATGQVKIVNRSVTGAAGSAVTASAERRHGVTTVEVTGSLPLGGAAVVEPVTVWEPTDYAVDVFRAALRQNGVRVLGVDRRGTTPAGAQELASRDSRPLSDIYVPFVKLSNNTIAEILIKSLGRKDSNRGTWGAGLTAVNKFLTANGVTGTRMTDGSGLSRADLVSPEILTKLLAVARTKPWFSAFYNALPIAGDPDRLVGGTLTGRMRGTAAAGNVHAKTGTLTSVSALSGYVNSAEGEPLIFSIMLNNHVGGVKDIEDAIAVRLAQFKRTATTSGRPSVKRLQTPAIRPGTEVECSWIDKC